MAGHRVNGWSFGSVPTHNRTQIEAHVLVVRCFLIGYKINEIESK